MFIYMGNAKQFSVEYFFFFSFFFFQSVILLLVIKAYVGVGRWSQSCMHT